MRLPPTTGFREPQMQSEQNREALLRVSTDLDGSLNSGIWDGGAEQGQPPPSVSVLLGIPISVMHVKPHQGLGAAVAGRRVQSQVAETSIPFVDATPAPGGTEGRQDGNQRKASQEALLPVTFLHLLLCQPCLLISRWPHHLDAQSSGLGF